MNTRGLIGLVAVVLFASALSTLCAAQATPSTDPVLLGCVVEFQGDVKLPAKEAGVLIHLGVKEGARVKAGDEIGKVDDRESQMRKKVSGYAYSAAYKRAQDDVEIRFSRAQAEVSKADYDQLLETNRRTKKAVTAVDIRRAKLDWERSRLAIEKAQHEQELSKYEAYTKQAEVQAADLGIERRTITAPFDGEVVTIYRKQNEWVSPGDPILRLVRLDTMQVEGAVDLSSYDPHEIQDSEVTVEVELAHGRKVKTGGKIIYVSPLVRLDGKCPVRAEVANRREHDGWLLRDGLSATMTIHLK